MERQEGIFHHILWDGLACCRGRFHKARLVFEDCFDELIHQVVREIGSPDRKIVHSDGDVVLVQLVVSSSRDLRGAELRHRFANDFTLFGRRTEECDWLLRHYVLERRRWCSDHGHESVDVTGRKGRGRIIQRCPELLPAGPVASAVPALQGNPRRSHPELCPAAINKLDIVDRALGRLGIDGNAKLLRQNLSPDSDSPADVSRGQIRPSADIKPPCVPAGHRGNLSTRGRRSPLRWKSRVPQPSVKPPQVWSMTSIAIIGGGIGGLAAAAALLRAGFDADLYEQSRTLGEVGAGINIGPNASRILHRFGIAGILDTTAVRPLSFDQRRWDDGHILLRSPLGDAVEAAFGAPYYTLHRSDLHRALANAIPAHRIHLEHRFSHLEHHGDHVDAHFENGALISADALIGADGIHSAVRHALFGPEEPRFTGCVAYRGLVASDRLRHLDLEFRTQVWMGPGRHFVHYFVSAGSLINFVAVTEEGSWLREIMD